VPPGDTQPPPCDTIPVLPPPWLAAAAELADEDADLEQDNAPRRGLRSLGPLEDGTAASQDPAGAGWRVGSCTQPAGPSHTARSIIRAFQSLPAPQPLPADVISCCMSVCCRPREPCRQPAASGRPAAAACCGRPPATQPKGHPARAHVSVPVPCALPATWATAGSPVG
jgi:hypothetical protein